MIWRRDLGAVRYKYDVVFLEDKNEEKNIFWKLPFSAKSHRIFELYLKDLLKWHYYTLNAAI